MRSIPISYSDDSSLTSTTDVRRPKNKHYVNNKRQPQYTYSTKDESTYHNNTSTDDNSCGDDRDDFTNCREDTYSENGRRDESTVCRDYASRASSHSSNNRGRNTKQHRNPRHRRSRRDISSQHSTSTTSSMNTSNSNSSISSQQFWTTLSIHAASAVMSSTSVMISKQLKIEAATIASASLLQHTTNHSSKKRQEKITAQTIRNAASKASIAILSNCGDGNSEINTELATVVAGAILKEGNRMLREMNQVDCRDDKSETGLSKKSSFTSSTRDSTISTTSEGGGTSLHNRTQMEPTSPQDIIQDDQTIQSISTSKFGSDKYRQLEQPKREKKNDTAARSISTSKYGKDKYAIDIVDSARSVSGEESSVPAVITRKSRVSVKDSVSGGSIGSRLSNKDKRSSRAASIQSKESNRMEAVAAGSTLSSLSVYTEPPKAPKEEATKASSNQSVANNSNDPSQVTTYQGDTSYLQSSIDSITSSQRNGNEQQMQHIQLQEDELERKHANFLAAMEKLQSKLDILEGHGVHDQHNTATTTGSLTRDQLLSLAAHSSELPTDQHQLQQLSMEANPTLHNLSSTESLSIHGRYSIPHCSTSILSSMNNKLQTQSHNYHHQQPQRPIRSVLRQPTRCFPIIEGEDQEYDDEDLQEFCKDSYNNLEGDATWDEDASVFLSVGECRTMHCEDNRDKCTEEGVPEKTTEEEAIEIVLLKDGDRHEQSSESLKNRVKDFFRGKRSKKVTFDVDIDPSTKNTSNGRYTPSSTTSIASARRRSRARKLLRRLKLQRRRLMTELRNMGRRYANEPKPSRVREDVIMTRTGMDAPSQRVEEGKKADNNSGNNDTSEDQKRIDLDMSRGSAQQSLPSSVDSLAPQIRFKRSNSTDSTNTSQAVCETLTENITTKDVNTTPAAEDDKVLVEAMEVVAEAQKDVSFADNNQYDEDASQYVADVVQTKDDEISCGVETVLSKKEVESVLSTKEAQSVASSSPSLFGFNFV